MIHVVFHLAGDKSLFKEKVKVIPSGYLGGMKIFENMSGGQIF